MIDKITVTNASGDQLVLNKDGDGNYILDNEGLDWGDVSAKFYTYKSPKQIGNEVYGTDVNSRTIMITAWLYGTEKQIAKNQGWLGKFFVPGEKVRVSTGGYYIEGYVQYSPQYSNKVKDNNEYFCKFVVSLYCGSPEFIKEQQTVVEYTTLSNNFHFPLVFEGNDGKVVFGVKEVSSVQKITNEGVHPVGMIITLKCNAESLSSVKLFDIYNQEEFIKIDKTLSFGEVIVIDTRLTKQDVTGTLNGVTSDYFRYWNFESTWMQINVGDNYIGVEYEGDAGSLDINVAIDNTCYVLEGM